MIGWQVSHLLEDRRDGRVLLVTPGNNTLEAALSTERADRLGVVEKISPDMLQQPEFVNSVGVAVAWAWGRRA